MASFADSIYAEGDARRVAVFSAKPYDAKYMREAKTDLGISVDFAFHGERLCQESAHLAQGAGTVCIFVNDTCDEGVLEQLHGYGVKMVALRCAGFNNVAAEKATELGITVARVPAYSPDAVAEHAVTLTMSLNRKIPCGWNKTRGQNFSLVGQMGFDMKGKRVGIIGTGLIGGIAARIFKRGFNCDVVAYDMRVNPKLADPEPEGLGIPYLSLDEVLTTADIISLHVPLFPATKHMINDEAIAKMKPGVIIINTSRGGLIDTEALIRGLKSKQIGGAGLDVYEGEDKYFFEDFSDDVIDDDIFARLLGFPNVIVTAHQAFFTVEALREISETTLRNVDGVAECGSPPKQRGTLETAVLAN